MLADTVSHVIHYHLSLRNFSQGLKKKYCLSLGSYHKSIIDWVLYRQQKFISHSSGGCDSKIKTAAESVFGESLLSSSLVFTWWKGMRDLWGLFYRNTNPIHEDSSLVT